VVNSSDEFTAVDGNSVSIVTRSIYGVSFRAAVFFGNIFPISQSSENVPAPKASTVRVMNKKGNGAACTNLSESLKMDFKASESAVT
jgi:hypothetical protein